MPQWVRLGEVNRPGITGPERTLVEGFRRPGLVGGLEELVVPAAGFATLDLEQLEEVLRRYGVRKRCGGPLAGSWSDSGGELRIDLLFPPAPEAIRPPPEFLNMPWLQGPPQAPRVASGLT